VRDLLWDRADLCVVIDRPRAHTMVRLASRSLRRAARREELWNGNREQLTNLLSPDPDRNLLLWSWRTHGRCRGEVPEAARAAFGPRRVVVVRRDAEAEALVAALEGGVRSGRRAARQGAAAHDVEQGEERDEPERDLGAPQ
jgi:hypothetical protein